MDLGRDTVENHIILCAQGYVGPQCCPLEWFGIANCKKDRTEKNAFTCYEKPTNVTM